MSTSYRSNHFERSYRPTALSNWEVPAQPRSLKPSTQSPTVGVSSPKFIADDKGHLLKLGARTGAFSPEMQQGYRWPESAVGHTGVSLDRYAGAASMPGRLSFESARPAM
mmetsp:Transcript_37102/g.92374  ORF Transcript_37102/g.92374 Transcript_37102/m.92374 type:complete len:110 (+) Transcript_37102:103-432(+)